VNVPPFYSLGMKKSTKWRGAHKVTARDYCTREGAEALKQNIISAWEAVGVFNVKCVTFTMPYGYKKLFYGVRGNLVNGMPPKEG